MLMTQHWRQHRIVNQALHEQWNIDAMHVHLAPRPEEVGHVIECTFLDFVYTLYMYI